MAKPDFNTMDIIDLEYPMGEENQLLFAKLRSDMIHQRAESKSYHIKTKFEYDDMRRVRIVDNLYYHAPINKGSVKTSYTLGIALPEDYGQYKLVPKALNLQSRGDRIRDAMNGKESGTKIKIANWELCHKMRTVDTTGYMRVKETDAFY